MTGNGDARVITLTFRCYSHVATQAQLPRKQDTPFCAHTVSLSVSSALFPTEATISHSPRLPIPRFTCNR